jgi:hypothetical protein
MARMSASRVSAWFFCDAGVSRYLVTCSISSASRAAPKISSKRSTPCTWCRSLTQRCSSTTFSGCSTKGFERGTRLAERVVQLAANQVERL